MAMPSVVRARASWGARLVLVSAIALLAAPAGAFAATARVVTITGVVKAPERVSVAALTLKGVIYPSPAVRSGHFTITVPAAAAGGLKNATLQVLSASGKYLGPVVLRKAREAANKHVVDDFLGLAKPRPGARIKLGTLTAEDHTTWFLARGAPAKAISAFVVRAANAHGRPYGAGTLGLVPHGGIPVVKLKHARIANARIATAGSTSASGADPAAGVDAVSCPSASDPAIAAPESGAQAGTLPGQQLDCSGVPNLFNVDVNGNDVLNSVDTAPASEAASEADFVGGTHGSWWEAASWYAPEGITTQAVSNFLVPSISFTPSSPKISALVPDIRVTANQFFPGDESGTGDTVTANCEGLEWCTSALLAEQSNIAISMPWSETNPPYSLPTEPGGSFGDQLELTVNPNGAYVPGQTILLTGTNASGQTAEIPAMVQPFLPLLPYVRGLTFSGGPNPSSVLVTDSAGNQVSASPTGTITLEVERPERLPLSGETSTSGVMDVAGLAYFVTIASPQSSASTACPQSAYSAVSGATGAWNYPSPPSGGWSDDTLQDFDPAAAGNPGPIEFTVDLSACVTGKPFATNPKGNPEVLAWRPGEKYHISVNAAAYVGPAMMTTDNFMVVAG